jgi:hypothetical protein
MDTAYPTLLDGEPPNIRAYPREAVVAEKLHAMVAHGERNTRYKDFFDIFALSARYPFAGATLASAITATFTRRKASKLEPWPVALTSGFYEDAARAEQWRRFLQRTKLGDEAPGDFALVGERMRAFLEAPLRATELGQVYMPAWPPGGPWQ